MFFIVIFLFNSVIEIKNLIKNEKKAKRLHFSHTNYLFIYKFYFHSLVSLDSKYLFILASTEIVKY
jgi:hypothetical protein